MILSSFYLGIAQLHVSPSFSPIYPRGLRSESKIIVLPVIPLVAVSMKYR